MDLIKCMSLNIITACVVSVLIEFLVPVGKMSKIMHSVLCLFVICVLISPVIRKNKMLNFDEIFGQDFEIFNQNLDFNKNINNQFINLSKYNIEKLILNELKKEQIFPKKIEIFMDINSDNCIEIIRAKIYLNKNYISLKSDIYRKVMEKFGVLSEIIEI